MTLEIGSLAVDPPVVLAPMAGLTDTAFRLLVRGIGGCGLVVTEFVSAEGVRRGVRSELEKLRLHPGEHPVAVQLHGAGPAAMAEAARRAEAAGADAVDLNLGCPARAVRRSGAGAALLERPAQVAAVVRAVRAATRLPLTAKLRSGVRAGAPTFLEVARACVGEGADGLTLHPRSAAQQYGGAADWSQISELKTAVAVPVVGNGDIATPDDAVRMVRETGCDGVMIGRGAVADPWLPAAVAARLAGRPFRAPDLAERHAAASRHLELLAETASGPALAHRIKVFLRSFTRGLPEGRRLRRRLSELDDPDALRAAVDDFFTALT